MLANNVLGVHVKYVIRFWTALIGLVFALSATIITASLGLVFSTILFVCALACTPIFYFFPNATDIIEQATQIVTSPLHFAGSTINAVWSQLWDVVTGQARTSDASDAARVTALTAMLLALSASCFIAVAIAPLSNYLATLGYIFASLIVVIVWAAAAIRLSHNSLEVIRVSAVVITVAVYATVITAIAISNFALQTLALTLAVVVLLLLAAISLGFVWDQTQESEKQSRPPRYSSGRHG